MIQYTNTTTGKVVDMPEPPEVQEAGDEAAYVESKRHRGRRAQTVLEAGLDRARRQADAAGKTIARMDESTKWERVGDGGSSAPPTDDDETPAEPAKKATGRGRKTAADTTEE